MGTIDVEPGDKIRRMLGVLEHPEKILRGIGAMLVAQSQRAFQEQSFDGKAWEPRGPINIMGIIADFAAGKPEPPKRRFQDRPALIDTGRLRQSVAFRLVGPKSLEAGSNLPYASLHQSGGETESAVLTDTVRNRIAEWLNRKGKPYQKSLGWLMAKKFRNKAIKAKVHARPFIGITKELREDAAEMLGVTLAQS